MCVTVLLCAFEQFALVAVNWQNGIFAIPSLLGSCSSMYVKDCEGLMCHCLPTIPKKILGVS